MRFDAKGFLEVEQYEIEGEKRSKLALNVRTAEVRASAEPVEELAGEPA